MILKVEFGKLLKKFEVLPPSYLPSADVQVGTGKDGVPKTKLTYKSGTSPSVRTLIIRRGDVTHLVNGADNGQSDAKASKVWKDFCGKNFGFMLNPENKQQQK